VVNEGRFKKIYRNCVSAKKQEAQNKLKNIEDDKIIVVRKEIESWYLAGATFFQHVLY